MKALGTKGMQAVVAVLAISLTGATRASAVPVNLPGDATIASPGDTTAIDVGIGAVTGLEAAAVSITFDPAVVTVPSPAAVQLGTVVSGCNALVVNLTTPGRATITVSCTLPVSGSGTLLTITFQGVAAGVSALAFSPTADISGGCQLNEGVPSCEPVDGQISVGPAPPTATPTVTPTETPTAVPTPTPVPAPATLIVRRAKLRADTATRAGRDDGALRLDGLVNANPPFGGFVEDLLAAGLDLRVTGAGGVDLELRWPAASCRVETAGRGPRVTCEVDDASGRRRATFRPTRQPNLLAATIVARRLALGPPPLPPGPLAVTLTTQSFARHDEIGGCARRGARQQLAVCLESGLVPTSPAAVSPAAP